MFYMPTFLCGIWIDLSAAEPIFTNMDVFTSFLLLLFGLLLFWLFFKSVEIFDRL